MPDKFEALFEEFSQIDPEAQLEKIREIRKQRFSETAKTVKKKAASKKKKKTDAQKLLASLSPEDLKAILADAQKD